MKKNNKVSTIISVLIIIFLFAIAIVIVIAGYNFIQGFTTNGEEEIIKSFVAALKGLSTIAIGIFILILVGILVFDNAIREIKDNLQIGFETIFGIQSRILNKEDEINDFLENKVKISSFIEENELLRKEISAKNDNIKGLLYKIEALEEECSSFEEKMQKMQQDVKSLKTQR